MRALRNILITGGAGFIGTNFIRYLFDRPDFGGRVINFDKLTYAGNPQNLTDIAERQGGERYEFVRGDICDTEAVTAVFDSFDIDAVVHFAAESHVDRSIFGPKAFVDTNITGTFNLLEAARPAWSERNDTIFHHVSTDEVIGSLGPEGYFTEETPYDPRSPYSASKAASDHMVRAYAHTFGLPVTITNCTNNYGPYQFPEKLIPVVINNMLEGKPIPVYGDGGENEWKNIDLVRELCRIMDHRRPRSDGSYEDLITFVTDRPGHDRRYAIDCARIKSELGWSQSVSFSEGLERIADWYLAHGEWMDSVKSGEYRYWIEHNYTARRDMVSSAAGRLTSDRAERP